MPQIQEQVINRVSLMSDADAGFILDIINRLIPQEKKAIPNEKMEAFKNLETLRGGFPADFDPDKELAEARYKKYGSVD